MIEGAFQLLSIFASLGKSNAEAKAVLSRVSTPNIRGSCPRLECWHLQTTLWPSQFHSNETSKTSTKRSNSVPPSLVPDCWVNDLVSLWHGAFRFIDFHPCPMILEKDSVIVFTTLSSDGYMIQLDGVEQVERPLHSGSFSSTVCRSGLPERQKSQKQMSANE